MVGHDVSEIARRLVRDDGRHGFGQRVEALRLAIGAAHAVAAFTRPRLRITAA